MAFLKVDTENSTVVNLYYEDHGEGTPVVLIHGWPLSGKSWEKQTAALIEAGYRVITYDRRGFGESSKPAGGYDDITLASDLNEVMTQLDLHNATLVGFSMGGVEVARYLEKYGTERVSKAVFISAVTPALLQTTHNPDGVDPSVFSDIRRGLAADRYKFLTNFFSDFYNVGLFNQLISEEAVRASWNVASAASPLATVKCVDSWLMDFRHALSTLEIPVLVIHGDSDKTVPYAASGARMGDLIKDCHIKVIIGGPHGILWTHAEDVNQELVSFINGNSIRSPRVIKHEEVSTNFLHRH